MKNSQVAAILGAVIGVFLIYFAFNSGERVIVGEMEDMRPIFGHVLNKPMLAAGVVLAAASIIGFGLGFRGSPGGAGTPAASPQRDTPPSEASQPDAPAAGTNAAGESEGDNLGT